MLMNGGDKWCRNTADIPLNRFNALFDAQNYKIIRKYQIILQHINKSSLKILIKHKIQSIPVNQHHIEPPTAIKKACIHRIICRKNLTQSRDAAQCLILISN